MVTNDGMAGMQPVTKTRLVDQVTERLRDQILSGALSPGTRLLQERLAQQLDVSRTPLREALRMLEKDGLVRTVETSNTVEVVQLSRQDARELYEIRAVLDGLAARLAARRKLPSEDLASLHQAVDAMTDSSDPFDTHGFLDAHTTFHLSIAEQCGNQRLKQLSPIIRMSSQMLYPTLRSVPDRMVVSAHEHAEILAAIERGDPAEAEQVARRHIETALDFWLSDDSKK